MQYIKDEGWYRVEIGNEVQGYVAEYKKVWKKFFPPGSKKPKYSNYWVISRTKESLLMVAGMPRRFPTRGDAVGVLLEINEEG